MSTTAKHLRMIFENAEGNNRAVSIADPVAEPGEQLVEDTMDLIIDNDVFSTTGGSLVKKVRAEVVERSVDTIYDAEEE